MSDPKGWRITKDMFIQKVGHPPENDDLIRVNCPEAGNVGHYQCGWCPTCDKPRFVCGHLKMKLRSPK